MTPAQRAKVEGYVRAKYKLAPATALQITESTAALDTCFRKINFAGSGGPKRFRLTLYASPDLRFLAPQLFDTHVDPVEEERKRLEAFRASLNPADSPSIGPQRAPVTITVFSDF